MKWTRHECLAFSAFWLALVGWGTFFFTGHRCVAIAVTLLVGAVIGLDYWPHARRWLSRPAFRRGFSLAAVLALLGVRW